MLADLADLDARLTALPAASHGERALLERARRRLRLLIERENERTAPTVRGPALPVARRSEPVAEGRGTTAAPSPARTPGRSDGRPLDTQTSGVPR